MKKLVKNKLFMTLFASDLLSNFGDSMYYLALMAYVLQLPNATMAISIVSVSETLPILTSFVMGYFADRTLNKVQTIFKTLLFRVVLYVFVGIIVGFQPSLWIVVAISIINFLSDLAGQYENGLYTPLSLRIVADEDRSDSFAFRQAVSSILSIGFQSAGAVLVSILSYQTLAFVNAGTFAACTLILLLVKTSLDKLLLARPISVEEKTADKNLFKDMWESMKEAIQECMAVPEIRKSIVIIPLLNGMFAVISIIVAVIISHDKQFVIFNAATTLASITLCSLVGGILGSVLAMNLLKNVDMLRGLRLATIFLPVFFFFLYIHNIYGVLIVMFLIMILAASLNPKMNALVLNTLPEEKLAMISGGLATYFQLGSVLLRLLVSGFILLLPIDWISLVFLGLGIAMVLYAYSAKKAVGNNA